MKQYWEDMRQGHYGRRRLDRVRARRETESMQHNFYIYSLDARDKNGKYHTTKIKKVEAIYLSI